MRRSSCMAQSRASRSWLSRVCRRLLPDSFAHSGRWKINRVNDMWRKRSASSFMLLREKCSPRSRLIIPRLSAQDALWQRKQGRVAPNMTRRRRKFIVTNVCFYEILFTPINPFRVHMYLRKFCLGVTEHPAIARRFVLPPSWPRVFTDSDLGWKLSSSVLSLCFDNSL